MAIDGWLWLGSLQLLDVFHVGQNDHPIGGATHIILARRSQPTCCYAAQRGREAAQRVAGLMISTIALMQSAIILLQFRAGPALVRRARGRKRHRRGRADASTDAARPRHCQDRQPEMPGKDLGLHNKKRNVASIRRCLSTAVRDERGVSA